MKIFKLMAVGLVAMIGLGSCEKDCDHNFIEYDYTNDLVGTWSVIGPDHAEALVIKADGTIEYTGVDQREYFEGTARYEVVNNRMKLMWDDGTTDEGRLDVVRGVNFSMTIDEETGAGFYYAYCPEDLSDKMVGSWMYQTDMTSEIHSYYADGTADCRAYYYMDEPYESLITGTYKVIGDILFETMVYGEGEDAVLSFASRISYKPDGSPFGDVMTSHSLGMNGEELEEYDAAVVRVKPSIDLAGKQYDYKETKVTNVKGDDMDINFMGYTFNFAKMDGSGLDAMLKTLLFHIEFTDANTLRYTYQQNNGKETFDVPVEVEDYKVTVKMSAKMPTLKDVVFYAFQNEGGNQMHLCMDKVAFVNFYTNMQAMLMEATDEQFDITDAEAVNAIHNHIDQAVETIKVSFVMEAGK